MGGTSTGRRLLVRYNYGYLVYSLSSPASPTKVQTKDLLGEDRYPKTGDGQTRTTGLAVSADGQRAVQGWGNEGGWGTVTFSYNGSYSGGGDFAPSADGVYANTIVKSGSRYLSFVSTAGSTGAQLWVADLTTLRTGVTASDATKNSVPSEKVLGPVLGATVSILKAVDGTSAAYVVAASADRVTVLDVSSVGAAVPGLSSNFTSHSYTLSDLGLSSGTVRSVSAAVHPTDGKLYLLVEAAGPASAWSQSTGVTLSKIEASGQAVVVGTHTPAAGARRSQAGSLLLPVDTDVVAVYLESLDAGGLDVHVRSGLEFSRNLASGVQFATPTSFGSLAGFRPSGGTIHLYLGRYSDGVYAASLDCPTAPTPAVAGLTAEKVSATGTTTPIADNGTAFVGDQVRYKPAFSPADGIQPVTDWNFDYDYHEGATADVGSVAPFVATSDVAFTPGGPFATQLDVLGPCDPAMVPSPVPGTGSGCWASVTTNGTKTASGNPDFATSLETGDPLPGATALLTTAFEVRNSLNGTGSSVAKHRINWKVPRALLKTTAMLTGGSLADGSEGTPATTGFKWYFSSVSSTPPGQTGSDILNLIPGCTGPTCSPGLTQRGTYRYWVQVPYRNGFRTPDCLGLSTDGLTCTGDATKTVNVTDVVLGFTVPSSSFVGAAALNVTSTSAKGNVTPCGGTSGFTYDRCTVNGTACTEGTYSGTGLALVGDPFAGGKLTIPTPPEGSWGIRIRYAYSTTGACPATDTAQWPAPGSAQEWAPVTVSQVQPIIKLQDVSGNSLCFGSVCDIYTGQSGRAWVYVDNGTGTLVKDPNPPALSWTFGNGSSGSTQGASFSYASAGTYTITLNGYGIPVTQDITASVQPTGGGGGSGGGGGGTTGLAVSSITFSPASPSTGQSVTVYCNATGGTAPYTEYFIAFGDGQTYSGTSKSTTHVYQTEGTKSVGCTVTDSSQTSAQRVQSLVVTAGSGGSCDFTIKNAQGARLQADPFTKRFFIGSGEPLTFDAVNAVGAVSWSFGDGKTATGSPATNTYNITGTTPKPFTISMTAGTCTKSYGIDVDPPTGPSFGVTDADTTTALARTNGVLEARAGQRLKFTANGTTGEVSWTFGDGTSSTEASPEKIYAPLVDTTYVVTLTNAGLSKQDSIAVKGSTGAPLTGNYSFKYADGTTVNRSAVQPNKPITFTSVDLATTYTWDFGDGSALAQGSPKEHTYTQGGTFKVKLTTAREGVTPVTTAAPFTFVVLPPPDPLLWVAGGMAYTDNGAGVKWQSDLSIHNPGSTTATLSLGFVAGNGWDGASKVTWVPQALVAGETKSFTNVLKSFFRLDQGSWGVVLVRGDDIPVPPIIVSRTYNASGAADIGTFGLSVPAMFVGAGVKPQSAGGGNVLAGLRHDSSFRTNLAVANLKDETAEVEVVFRDGNGTVLGVPARITIEARGVKQLNAILSAAPAGVGEPIGGSGHSSPASNFSAEVTLKKGTGVYPYATVIDQGTGDSIVVTPAARPSPTYRLPGIVRVKGKNGPYWVSDIAVLNPSSRERKVTVTYSYVKSGAAGRATMSSTLTFKPWEMKVAVDFVKVWLGLADDDPNGYASSYVDITPAADDVAPAENLVAVGKTYTPSGNGSVGLQVDPFAYEDGISAQSSRKRIVLSGLDANPAYRTNLALFVTPGSTGNVQVDVKVLDSFGRLSKAYWGVGLNADTPIVQLNSGDLFSGLTTDDISRATIVIDNPRGTAVVGAYATVIDNKSEDATFVVGQPAP